MKYKQDNLISSDSIDQQFMNNIMNNKLFNDFNESEFTKLVGGAKKTKSHNKYSRSKSKQSRSKSKQSRSKSKKISKKKPSKKKSKTEPIMEKIVKKSSKKTSKKTSKKSKRTLPLKLQQFQKFVSHLRTNLGSSPSLLRLAKTIREKVAAENPKLKYEEIIEKSIKEFDDNKDKYTKEYQKLKQS